MVPSQISFIYNVCKYYKKLGRLTGTSILQLEVDSIGQRKCARIFAWSSFPLDGTKLALSPSANREFKKWRGQRPRQHHKSMIRLAEWGKIIVLHVRHAFCCKFLTQSAKWRREIYGFEVLVQREPTAVNLSFSAFAWKPFVPSKRKCSSPILNNVSNLE